MQGKNKKKTKCRCCGTSEARLFARNPMRDNRDFFCKNCLDSGLQMQKIIKGK